MSDTLGSMLEKARRSLGRSLTEAEAVTRIRAKRLEALEAGDYDSLPSPAYVRGYIISYAKFLGLDPAPLLEAYAREAGAEEPESPRLPEPVVTPRSQAHQIPFRAAVAVVAIVAVLALTVWGVGRLLSGPEAPPPIPVVPEPTATAEPSTEPTSVPGVDDADDQAPPSGDAEEQALPSGPFTVRVEIEQGSASWMRVTIDGLVAYEGTLAGGQTQEWTAEESAELRIGRAPAVTVYQDDVEVEIPSGDPPVLVLPQATP